ncbi:MAG: hypothetical protein K2Y37_14915 [Pirellulales bacterium]|nr:hypothetical protein [Pirellulales bacterium]
MSPAVWLVAVASLGIDVGWQPVDEGGYELFLQIEPEQLELLRAGEPLTSDLPAFAERVVRVHWMVGTDQLPQTTRPATTPGDSSATAMTANRPIDGAATSDLALTDGRTAKPADVPTAAASTSDGWHTATTADAKEPATTSETEPAPDGSVDASLANVGPVDPSETNVDLSDGIEVASTPAEAVHNGPTDTTALVDAAAATKPALDKGTVTTASTATPAEEQHRARPETPPATAPATGADENAAKDTAATDGPAAPSPGLLNWLATMAALGASLAANVFFLWGFVDARRRYRLALHEHGLRNSALQPT